MYEERGVFMKQERYGKTQTSSEAQLTQDPGPEPPKTGWTKNRPLPGEGVTVGSAFYPPVSQCVCFEDIFSLNVFLIWV